MMSRLFAVGTDEYDKHVPLNYAVSDIDGVYARLSQCFTGEPLRNATEKEIRDALKVVSVTKTDTIVVVWSGHGRALGNQLELVTRDGTIFASEVVAKCVESGASQILVILDTCHAEHGMTEAHQMASALLNHYPRGSARVWFGIVVSCRASERARDGAFGELLVRLLTHGPIKPDLKRRWSRHNRFIFGDDLGAALQEGPWDVDNQRPDFLSHGRRWFMIPNPLYDPGAPEQVVEHLLQAARGGNQGGGPSWFTGRVDEVNHVVDWVHAREPGLRVLTGSACTGKSAILGRVVSLSNPTERARLLKQGLKLQHNDPGESSVAAHIHARGLTVDRAAQLLDGQLVRSSCDGYLEDDSSPPSVLPPAEPGRRNAAELVGALQREYDETQKPPVIIVDGLDEARGEVFAIASELLLRLAAFATVVVSTRPVRRQSHPEQLMDVLSPVDAIDLDSRDGRASQTRAMRDYVLLRLNASQSPADPYAICAELTEQRDDEEPSFLLARIVLDQLTAEDITARTSNWQESVADSIGSAFDRDLSGVMEAGVTLPDGKTPKQLASIMLTALTWALGAGFPEDEWLAVAACIAGNELNADHISWLLDQLGRYVIADGEGGIAVYRIAHQSLADHLRTPHQASLGELFDPAASTIWTALAARYQDLLSHAVPADGPNYLWRYAHRHAAACGDSGISPLRTLVPMDQRFEDDVARAGVIVAATYTRWGNHDAALERLLEAVKIYERQVDTFPVYEPSLAAALDTLGNCYAKLGKHDAALSATKKAVDRYESLSNIDPGHRPGLAVCLNNLGLRLSALAQFESAREQLQRAFEFQRDLLIHNPAHLPYLADTLNNLGSCLTKLFRYDDALTACLEATEAYRRAVATSPVSQPGFAKALNNLGGCYKDVGQDSEALGPSEESVTLWQRLADENPSHSPDLANALSNLSIRLAKVGRMHEAEQDAESAVHIYRESADGNDANLPSLAWALTVLGARKREIGLYDDALCCDEEAVHIYQQLVGTNRRAHLPGLASANDNVGIDLGWLERQREALRSTRRAVLMWREVTGQNPGHERSLASALDNLGVRHAQLHQHPEALKYTTDAVERFRRLIKANPTCRAGLANALNNQANRYHSLSRYEDALSATEDAIKIREDLARENPGHLHDLAASLLNLSIRYVNLERAKDAVEAAKRAVDLNRGLVKENARYLPDLALAINNLGSCYFKAKDFENARSSGEEAVSRYRELTASGLAYSRELASALYNLSGTYALLDRRSDALSLIEESVALNFDSIAGSRTANLNPLVQALARLEDIQDARSRGNDGSVFADALAHFCDKRRQATLLRLRSAGTFAGYVAAAPWLVEALELADGYPMGILLVRDEARRHRQPDPQRWDDAWTRCGEQIPQWLTVDFKLLATTRDWIYTPSYRVGKAYLNNHPELLEAAMDEVLEEVLLAHKTVDADHWRHLLAAARTDGIDVAYLPFVAAERAGELRWATTHDQLHMIDRYLDLLTHPSALQCLAEEATVDADEGAVRALALARVAAAAPEILPSLKGSLTDPEAMAEILPKLADHVSVATTLGPVSALTVAISATAAVRGVGYFYRAIAATITGDGATAVDYVHRALAAAPEQRTSWAHALTAHSQIVASTVILFPHLVEGQQR